MLLLVEAFGPEEKYSRGRRGAPAKGVGRETGARVQIPPSPFFSDAVSKEKNSLILRGFFFLSERQIYIGQYVVVFKACKFKVL